MSSDAIVTLEGWVGNDPQSYTAGSATLAKFRLGHTPRRKNRQTGEWSDGETQWFTVSAWRQLGDHCVRSIHKGDPVIVHGRLTQRTWQNKAGEDVVSLEIDAISVGHDLSMGFSNFIKTVGSARSATAPAAPAAATPTDAVADWRTPDESDPPAVSDSEAAHDSSAA